MAMLGDSSKLPKDAVRLTDIEAIDLQWSLVDEWDKPSEVWALHYSPLIAGGISSLCGLYLNSHYRGKVRLGSFAKLSTLLPNVLLPGMLTTLFHRKVVTTDMLMQRHQGCLACYEMRAASVQMAFGFVYPLVLSATSTFMFSNRYATYRLPPLTKPKEVFALAVKFTKPITSTLQMIVAAQLIIASVLTYLELKNFINISSEVESFAKTLNSN